MKKKNILVPELPESVNDATIIRWHKSIGEVVKQDEILVDIETEKVILEVPSIIDGKLEKILSLPGSIVKSKQIIGHIKEINTENEKYAVISSDEKKKKIIKDIKNIQKNNDSPSYRRIISKNQNNVINQSINTKEINKIVDDRLPQKKNKFDKKTIVPLTNFRKRIANRLLQTKKNTVMLTTFNEINMSSVIKIRKKYKDLFQEKHTIKLGFMSFFIKAVVQALKKFPNINAKINNNNIIYYHYFDINIAISTTHGLITPILKNVDNMSMAEIEKKIFDLRKKAELGKLELSDLLSGNFTITNGGVFGSLFSTPIINPPQTAILGMHAIQDRVIVVHDKITIAPMMYIALSYDHQLIDGKESVGFLKTIKEVLEDFSRIMLDI
ncbi:dihydrolipoyllysine-residue succinyltransferase [Buchnera aphidicola]|uniref:dihydrolipoyllysine-residue succinyltransferase n=1 Tax=Buchnera aphidicola TaxID=9 RepID=UPI0031B7F180